MYKRLMAACCLILFAAATLAGCTRRPAQPEGAVARIDGAEVPAAELQRYSQVFELYFNQKMDAVDLQSELLQMLISQKLLAAEAAGAGMTVTPAERDEELERFLKAAEPRYGGRPQLEAKMQEIGLTSDQLANFIEEFLLAQKNSEAFQAKISLTDDEIAQFYEENRTSLYTFTEEVVRAAHILVPADQEATAKELEQRIKGGEDFATLAREYSTDPGSAATGGDLGYFTRGDMVTEFSEAAFALNPDEVSAPVKSQFGWHIIKLLDKRPAGVIPLEAAKSDIVNKLLPSKQQEALQQHIEELKIQHKVEILLPEPAPGVTPAPQNSGKDQ